MEALSDAMSDEEESAHGDLGLGAMSLFNAPLSPPLSRAQSKRARVGETATETPFFFCGSVGSLG